MPNISHGTCRILFRLGRQAEMQTELTKTESQQLNAMSIEDLMLSFRQEAQAKHSSQMKGVYYKQQCQKWCSRMDGGRKHLGYFATEMDAAAAFDRALIAIHGRQATCWSPHLLSIAC